LRCATSDGRNRSPSSPRWSSRKFQDDDNPPIVNASERESLLQALKRRFEAHMKRHPRIAWSAVQTRLESNAAASESLHAMEASGGEPDVIGQDAKTGRLTFCDYAAESPLGRRSLCYDREALESRKENKPAGTALDMAADMGIELLSEEQYRGLQQLGNFDAKTSSWIITPPAIRKLGGALFCDFRYDTIFVYHNGASSYYAARGFRGALRI